MNASKESTITYTYRFCLKIKIYTLYKVAFFKMIHKNFAHFYFFMQKMSNLHKIAYPVGKKDFFYETTLGEESKKSK